MTDFQHADHPDLDTLLGALPSEEADRLRETWHLVGQEEPVAFPQPHETAAALRQFDAMLDQQATSSQQTRHQRTYREARVPRRKSSFRRIGLGVLVLLFLGILGGFWWMQPVTKTAPFGERLTLTLPDGSTVELNSGSSLRYARRFGAVRQADLQGEAFFDVIKETRPFIVRTFNAQVEVLGTRFNVRAWPQGDDQSSTVALEAGRVAVAPRINQERVTTLQPGQTHRILSAEETAEESTSLSVEDATAWRRGDFILRNQPLGTVLDDVERRFAVTINLQAPSLRQTRMNLALRQPANAETIVRDLAGALALSYRKTSTGYELYESAP